MNISVFTRLSLGVAALAIAAPSLAQTPAPATASGTAQAGPRYGTFGVDLTAEDTSVKPGDDFWTFANGNWDKRTQIAADRTSAGYMVTLADQAEG
jgi:putative endopeptidase